MTGIGWAALALTAAVAVASLLLSLALARRMRQLAALVGDPGAAFELPQPGEPVPAVEMTTTSGAAIDISARGEVLLAFLSTDCDACRSLASSLTAEEDPGRIAIVIGPPAERSAMVAELEPVMPVVEQADHTGLAASFGVRAFPAVLLVGDGTVKAAGHQLGDIRVGQPG
jgi:hypothetical protein